ncbi:MAG: hypothetical protein HY232_16925 [Acidobacteria bacterium]|nr:hypothetical protein [Acidobacteriota bacterium]
MKARRGVVILPRFENISKEDLNFVSELAQAVKNTLQMNGLDVYEAASEEATRNLLLKIREDDVALVQCTLSETLTRTNLSGRISFPHRNGPGAIALAGLEKKQRTRTPAGGPANARHVVLQEIYRSPALPFKVLDAAIAALIPEQPPLLLLLTEARLLAYRFDNNNLTPDFQVSAPLESDTVVSRDSRGSLGLYHYQDRDHILMVTHRTGGTLLLRAEDGKWSFQKLSPEWLFKTRRPPAQSMVVGARLVPGRNYFTGEIAVFDFARFASIIESRIRDRYEGPSFDLSLPSSIAQRGKVSSFYHLNFVDQNQAADPLIVCSGLDGRLRLYGAAMQEVSVFRDPMVGATFTAYSDPNGKITYIFATAPSLPETSDALTVLELKGGELKAISKTNNYPGSITALAVGQIAGREGLSVVAVLESKSDMGVESTLYIFNLRG